MLISCDFCDFKWGVPHLKLMKWHNCESRIWGFKLFRYIYVAKNNIWKWMQVLDHWSSSGQSLISIKVYQIKVYLLVFFPCILLPMAPARCTQYLGTVFSSTDVQDCSWKSVWTKLPQACLCFTSSDTIGRCVLSCALMCPKDRACTLVFFII